MMAVLAGAAMLCGIPIGFIIGVMAAKHVYRSAIHRQDDPDYSGGV